MRKSLSIFLLLLMVLALSVWVLGHLNRERIKREFNNLTTAEGQTIQQLLRSLAGHLLAEGDKALIDSIKVLYTNETIVYIGLFKGERLVHLDSRFEEYFPILAGQEDVHIIDSPLGDILDIRTPFQHAGTDYRLHIGFNYQFLNRFESSAQQNFLLLLILFALIALFSVIVVIGFEKRAQRNRLTLARTDQERQHFKELSILTAEIAHEIKNPLNAIYLAFGALEKSQTDSQEALYYRDAIRKEIKRINGIITSYTRLARDIHPQIAATDIAVLLQELKWLLDHEFSPSGIHFTVEAEQIPLFHTDGALLKQVLLNLVKNAQEAGAHTIRIAAHRAPGWLILEVHDDGQGIAPPMAQEIFKPYTSSKTKGMGLGLTIVSRIINVLNGTINLESSRPGQTLFRLTLPEEHQNE